MHFLRRVSSLRLIKPDIDIQQSISIAMNYEHKVLEASPDQVGTVCFTAVGWIAHVGSGILRSRV